MLIWKGLSKEQDEFVNDLLKKFCASEWVAGLKDAKIPKEVTFANPFNESSKKNVTFPHSPNCLIYKYHNKYGDEGFKNPIM